MEKLENIQLDKQSDEYLYIQLYKKIKQLLLEGNIEPHSKLPTIRHLAKQLDVNNVTIVNTYNLLEQKGYVYKKVGSGTFVQDILNKNRTLEFRDDDVSSTREENNIINFVSTAPTEDLFPIEDIKLAINQVLDRDKGMAFTYQESQGYYPLRNSIKNYLSEYGINTSEDNIQIISGAQQGIDILSKALIDYGDIVFTENPTYSGAIAVFKSRSARTIEINLEEDGLDIRDLENKLRSFRPKFIYVMPIFQNPTGYSYSLKKKYELLELASKYDFYIIEDDFLSDLSFNNDDNQTLKSLDRDDRVIYLKSFSKIAMPGLRLAFMVIPRAIYNEVLSAKHISDISTSGLIQRSFDVYLSSGKWKKNLEYISIEYMNRFTVMVESIKEYIPKDIKYILPKGGLNFWFSLPDGYSSNELYKKCLQNNLSIAPGSAFNVNQTDNEHFRLSVASLDCDEIRVGINKLSQIIVEFLEEYKRIRPSVQMYNTFI